jgi:hypothetical protein
MTDKDPFVLTDLELVAVSLVEEPVNPDCGFGVNES